MMTSAVLLSLMMALMFGKARTAVGVVLMKPDSLR
jgi:hypothetical protein